MNIKRSSCRRTPVPLLEPLHRCERGDKTLKEKSQTDQQKQSKSAVFVHSRLQLGFFFKKKQTLLRGGRWTNSLRWRVRQLTAGGGMLWLPPSQETRGSSLAACCYKLLKESPHNSSQNSPMVTSHQKAAGCVSWCADITHTHTHTL